MHRIHHVLGDLGAGYGVFKSGGYRRTDIGKQFLTRV
jgi:hypothetical protein